MVTVDMSIELTYFRRQIENLNQTIHSFFAYDFDLICHKIYH